MIKEKIKEMGYEVFLGLVAVIIVLAFIYKFIIGNLFLALLSMGIAVIGCYYLFRYILEEEEPLTLRAGETLILKTLDRGAVLFPRKKGKFFGRKGSRDLSIYLTSERIIARGRNEFILDLSLDSVLRWGEEEKLKSNYLRVGFMEKKDERDVLLFVGDTKLWMDKLSGLVKREGAEFTGDVGRVKDLI